MQRLNCRCTAPARVVFPRDEEVVVVVGRRDAEVVEVAERREAVGALDVEARPAARLAAAAALASETFRPPTGAGGCLAGKEAARLGDPTATVVKARLPRVIRWRQTGQAEWLSSQEPMHRRQKICVQGVMAGFVGVSRQMGQSLGMLTRYWTSVGNRELGQSRF